MTTALRIPDRLAHNGPLAIGSIISTDGTNSYAQNFSAYLYAYGVQMNVTVDPSYCTYS